MTKTTTAGMDTHLAEEATSLSTCWEITREDGVQFFFTDHDVDILYAGDLYLAETGYKRSAIQNDSSLAVDNLDLEGIFDSVTITEQDMRAGLFDYAKIKIFVVNWADLTDGQVKMRSGRLGEVNLTDRGMFKTELRGLSQALSQRIGELYQPECRADLGDTRCTVPIEPPERADSTAYALGDYIVVPTTTVPASFYIPIVNAGFDTGDLTGWTTVLGTPRVVTSDQAVLPQAGTHFLQGTGSVDYEVSQIVDITGIVSTVDIDAGNITCDALVWQNDSFAGDLGAFTVEALDNVDAVVSTLFDSGFAERGGPSVWTTTGVTMTGVVLPATTEKIRYRLRGQRTVGIDVNAEFDSLSSNLTNTAAFVATQGRYENRIYECTVAGTTAGTQPAYTITVDADTVDGTATFTSRQAWTRDGSILTVEANDTFALSIAFDEVRGIDDWFNGGALTFQTGPNTGKTIEVRNWVLSTLGVTLFLPAAYTVSPLDLVKLYPGCDKTDLACQNKWGILGSLDFALGNIKNFRGEPHIPGVDQIARYPDAK
tara:strand:+ start:882 stop:2507 length:1626 start_codon:yes stop_codon:yes gene_type:complete